MQHHAYAKRLFLVVATGAALVLSGCTHPIEVKNIRTYQTQMSMSLNNKLTLGIIPQYGDPDCQMIMRAVSSSLASSADIIMPYQKGSSRKVDVIANIAIQPDYRGSLWNFWINWPGFLIFTPAWNGYVYKVGYKVDVDLAKAGGNEAISSFSIPIELDVRHAAMNRTWTELSYLEVSVIAFVGGVLFIEFDDQVSTLTAEKAKDALAGYISAKILTKLSAAGY